MTVTAAVLEGLEAVRLSGETDMGDTLEVQAQAYLMGYSDTTWWLEFFPNLYIVGQANGFVVEAAPISE